MAGFETHYIPENVIPNGYIDVYNGAALVGRVKAGPLRPPELGAKLYSFGALADVHVTHSALAMSKFGKALEYFNSKEHVAFTCIAGDLISSGTEKQFKSYVEARDTYSPDAEVYECMGNHDVESATVAPFLTRESTRPYIGRDLYYSWTQGDDLFVMFGMSGWPGKTGTIFTAESLQWLYELLEGNRNRRVFLFEHCPSMVVSGGLIVANDGSGNLSNTSSSGAVVGWPAPTGNLLNQGDTGLSFRNLMTHYRNVVWIHGHSHMEFQYQEKCSHLNYDRKFGCHSIHIPSLAEGRELNEAGTGFVYTTAESSGYVVDVYANHIVLRGRDFAGEKFVPIATFCLDTTPQAVAAGTFSDSTGVIKT